MYKIKRRCISQALRNHGYWHKVGKTIHEDCGKGTDPFGRASRAPTSSASPYSCTDLTVLHCWCSSFSLCPHTWHQYCYVSDPMQHGTKGHSPMASGHSSHSWVLVMGFVSTPRLHKGWSWLRVHPGGLVGSEEEGEGPDTALETRLQCLVEVGSSFASFFSHVSSVVSSWAYSFSFFTC